MQYNRNKILAVMVAAVLPVVALAACDGTRQNPIDSMNGLKADREARMATFAAEEIAAGRAESALRVYEQRYGTRPQKEDIALNYAQLLRRNGRADDAIRVLENIIGTEALPHGDIGTRAVLFNEYAAAKIQTGDLARATEILDALLKNDQAAAYHADSANLAGVALDAQGKHREAEDLFQRALAGWRGDRSSVMNNLALSLASQGRFDESLETLRKALMIAPDKTEIARNIDIITGLRNKIIPTAPVKVRK